MPRKIRILTARHYDEIEVDVADCDDIILGSAFHWVVENVGSQNYRNVERITIEIDGLKYSGQPDLYHIPTATIEDYKTAAVWKWVFNKDDWERRMNQYAYLMELFYGEEYQPIVERLMANVYFKDWRPSELLRYGKEYPQERFYSWEAPLWTAAEQLDYIRKRIAYHREYERVEDDAIPECTPEERWRGKEIYAIYKLKKDNTLGAKAVNAQCETRFDALKKIEEYKEMWPGNKYTIQHRPGIDRRCTNPKYCYVRPFCHYWRENYADGILS